MAFRGGLSIDQDPRFNRSLQARKELEREFPQYKDMHVRGSKLAGLVKVEKFVATNISKALERDDEVLFEIVMDSLRTRDPTDPYHLIETLEPFIGKKLANEFTQELCKYLVQLEANPHGIILPAAPHSKHEVTSQPNRNLPIDSLAVSSEAKYPPRRDPSPRNRDQWRERPRDRRRDEWRESRSNEDDRSRARSRSASRGSRRHHRDRQSHRARSPERRRREDEAQGHPKLKDELSRSSEGAVSNKDSKQKERRGEDHARSRARNRSRRSRSRSSGRTRHRRRARSSSSDDSSTTSSRRSEASQDDFGRERKSNGRSRRRSSSR